MAYLIVLYNSLLIMLFSAVASLFGLTYLRDKRKVYGWVALLFVFYILDNIIIYMTEAIDEFARYYDNFSLSSNTIKTGVLIGTMICLVAISGNLFHLSLSGVDKAVLLVYAWTLIVIPLLPTSRLFFWAYFTVTQLLTSYLVLRAWRSLEGREEELGEDFCRRCRSFFKICLVFNLAIVVEDAVVIFLFDQVSPMDARINQRSLSEDLLSVYCAVKALRVLVRGWTTAPAAAVGVAEAGEEASAPQPAPDLRGFGSAHSLTPREVEVLELLVQGMTNQQISDQLYITLGTTKNHIHNIYQKCEVVRRSQMLRLVNESLQSSVVEQ